MSKLQAYMYGSILYLIMTGTLIGAQDKKPVPILDRSTVSMPETGTHNKCIGKNSEVTYTQFACPETFELSTQQWRENSNLTFGKPIHDKKPSIIAINNEASGISDSLFYDDAPVNQLIKGLNIDEKTGLPNFENMSPAEIIKEGIRLFMLRKQILDSI